MKIRKKKKGSTFVIVVIVMAIIFMTGTTILAVTANDYKMRINQSKKLQNLYEADSGLDVVENIIIKTSQEAIKYADKEVKREFTKLDDTDRSKDKINELFKEKFYEFLTIKNKEILNSKEVEILEYLILEKKYIKSILESGKLEYDSAVSNTENRFVIEIPEDGYAKNMNNGKISDITIEVKSTFESTEGQLRNKKTVSTNYVIAAPDYNSEITSINIYPVFDGKAITADGNMEVIGEDNKEASINISGDIWIKGMEDNKNQNNNPAFTFDKYKNGIELNNANFNINGNIYTANTYHLNNNVKGTVNGDIFAKNIYIGKSINSIVSQLNNISFEKNVIVNNDLALNAINSSIVIKSNFYGINDKTTEVSTANKALNSSSIIINDSNKTSTITVNEDSYIMGVAYLNATDESGNKYQTGESLAVKGNYLAYTDVDDVLNGQGNVNLKYYSPLQLLESKNGQSNAAMKAEYFSEYYSRDNNPYRFNDGGVRIKGSVKSVGTSVKDNNGSILKANIMPEDLNLVNEQRNEFARNVFTMGDATGFENLYDGQEVKRQVSNQVDFNEVRRIQGNSFDTSEGTIILKGNQNDNLEIENGKIKGTDKELNKGLIITNGDITIEGNFDFTGNIITTGNIIFKDEGEKNITYDPQIVRSILALNNNLLKDIFVKSESNREEIKITSASELYSVDKFLTKSLWRISK